MENFDYPRGSIWRKWDLHVHTPSSIINNYGKDSEETWEKFISDLENLPEEFKVLGINDYLFLDGYKKVLEYKDKGRLQNINLILPVLEFRLYQFSGTGNPFKKVNFHVVFSDQITPEIIQQQFLNGLTRKYQLSPGMNGIEWEGIITRESLADLGEKIKESIPPEQLSSYGSDLIEGFNNLTLEAKVITQALENSSYFNNGKTPLYFTAVGKTEWADINWQDGSIGDKKDVINNADFVFISSETEEMANQAKETLTNSSVNDLLLDCSDAHDFSDSEEKDRIGKCYTWIKADPTFEGLRQILFEPDERVCLTESNPSIDKVYFSKLSFKSNKLFPDPDSEVSLKENSIILNPNLVTIIGGRGTGKSLLLDCVAKTFGKDESNERVSQINLDKEFDIKYQKLGEQDIQYSIGSSNNLSYLHIHQGEVKDIVKKVEKLSTEIKEMLGINEDIYDSETEDEIIQINRNIQGIKDWFQITAEKGQFVNDLAFNKSKINEFEDLIDTITTENNEQLITEFRENNQEIEKLENRSTKAKALEKLLTENETVINEKINEINEVIDDPDDYIPTVDFSSQSESITSLEERAIETLEELSEENEEIRNQFKKQGISGDISSLLNNVDKYQTSIEKHKQKIQNVKNKKQELEEVVQKRIDFANKLKGLFNNQIINIEENWSELKKGKESWSDEQNKILSNLLDGIEINGTVHFNKKTFYEIISADINLTKFKKTGSQTSLQRLTNCLNVTDSDSFLTFLSSSSKCNMK